MNATALTLPWVSPTRWTIRRRSDPAGLALADRHYSRRSKGKGSGKLAGPGRALVLVTGDEQALWVATHPRFNADDLNVYRCSIFRNEGSARSSDLIREAMLLTEQQLGPAPGWATWVDRRRVASSNPGYCFLCADWTRDRTYAPGYRQRHLLRLIADPLLADREIAP